MNKQPSYTNDQLTQKVAELTDELNKLKEYYKQSQPILGNSGGDIKDIVVWKMDEKGRYTYLSPNVEVVLGYKPEEMLGTMGLTYFRAEDVPQIQKKMKARIDGNREPSEFIMVAKDGSLIDMELYSVSIKDQNENIVGFSGIARNISDRKLAEKNNKKNEKKIIQEKEFTEQVINALPGLFYQISTEGKFINWNKNFETITGYSATEIKQLSPIELFEGDDKKHIADRIQESFSVGNSHAYANLISKKGFSTPYYWTGKTIIINNEPFLIGMGTDISELKNIENELMKHQEQLEELVKERTKDLEIRNNELDSAIKVFVGREILIRDMQNRIAALESDK